MLATRPTTLLRGDQAAGAVGSGQGIMIADIALGSPVRRPTLRTYAGKRSVGLGKEELGSPFSDQDGDGDY